jgi:chaperone BCS1
MKIEHLTMSVFGSDPAIIKSLISDAIENVSQKASGHLRIFVRDSWRSGWKCVMSKRPRSLESVILNEALSCSIIEDVRVFLGSKRWYGELGIPHRRGYLLHGPPGCGKTSFCQALAGVLQFDICMLSLNCRGLDDTELADLVRVAPLRSILMLEDVDAIFQRDDDQTASKESRKTSSSVTFSGLLNAIDGVVSQEGRLLIMTTNHIERLDPALLRPGRCDVKVLLSNASVDQLARMFVRFFPGEEDKARRFASLVPAGTVSLARIQSHLVEHRFSAETAIDTVSRLIQPI